MARLAQGRNEIKKQNVLMSSSMRRAEWLIANKYTRHRSSPIGGDSMGGLLIGAAVTQRPDLFGANFACVRRDGHVAFSKSSRLVGVGL